MTEPPSVRASDAAKILSHLQQRRDQMVSCVSELARMESPSEIASTQTPLFEWFTSRLSELGFRCRRIPGKSSGGQLLAVPRDLPRRANRQLLLGHCDTVWPLGTLEKMPVESRDGLLYGPGVYDMKAGLVQAFFALTTLRDLGLQPSVAPLFFLNSDEEIGSVESASHIRRLARVVDRAMVMEPSLGPSGCLKTTRKGVGRFLIVAAGRAAHAGLDPEKGVSAILEISHVVQALFSLNDPERGITVNVGTIEGGTRPNVIASTSRVEVDVRVRTHQDARQIERTIHSLQTTVPQTSLTITGTIARPPLEPTPGNRQLWQRAVEAAKVLQIDIDEAAAGGGSDGNWTSLYTPTLDGLGAVGDGAHALTEHIVEAMLPPRAALLACLLLGGPISSSRGA